MPKWSVCVVYPVYFEVEADNGEDAEVKAIEDVDKWFDISSITPVLESMYELNEDGNIIDEYGNEI